MKIYFDGCSWTKGEELEHPKEERYSKLICDDLKAEEYNFASNGGSNDRIVRNLLVEHNIQDYDLAVIQMTYPARTEYYNQDWIKVNPKHNYSRWLNRKKDKRVNIDKLSEKFTEYQRFWKEYYTGVISKTFITTKEKIHYQTIQNHCEVKKVPLILLTINQWTVTSAHQLNVPTLQYHRYGHPTKESHRAIANYILKRCK
mgnify:FL=1